MPTQLETEKAAADRILAGIERLLAACESDADLAKLPALRGFIEQEIRGITEALKPLLPDDPSSIYGLVPGALGGPDADH